MAPTLVDGFECDNPEDSAAITFIVIGGEQPYSFEWSNGSTDSIAYVYEPGNYFCTVTDALGRSRRRRYRLRAPDKLELRRIEVRPASCGEMNGSATFITRGGTEPIIITSQDGTASGGGTFGGLPPGIHYLTISDDSGCAIDTFVMIDSVAELTVSSSAIDNVCFGSSEGEISITIEGGQSPYSTTWSNGSTTKDLTGLPAGRYDLVVIDDLGCIRQVSQDIGQGPQVFVNFDMSVPSCAGKSDGSLVATVTGDTAPFSYTWDNGKTGHRIENLTAGTYCITITDAQGCSYPHCYEVLDGYQIETTANIKDAGCGEAKDGAIIIDVTNGKAPYTYQWSGEEGPLGTERSLTKASQGNYQLIVTDNFGCTDISTFEVNATGELPIELTSEDPLCAEQNNGKISINNINGVPPYQILWEGPSGFRSNGQSLDGLLPGNYNLTAIDSIGCESNGIVVTLTDPAPLVVRDSIVDVACIEDQTGVIVLHTQGGTLPYQYEFNGALAESRVLAGVGAGTYTAVVTDAQGCKARLDDLQVETMSNLALDLGEDLEAYLGEPFFLNPDLDREKIVKANWSGSDLKYLTEPQSEWTSVTGIDQSLYYQLTVTDIYGCTATDDINIILNHVNILEVPSAFSPNGDGENDILSVFGTNGTEVMKLLVFNRSGAIVYQAESLAVNDKTVGWDGTINGQQALQDTYIWKATARFTNGEEKSFSGSTLLIR